MAGILTYFVYLSLAFAEFSLLEARGNNLRCPEPCSCMGQIVDCSFQSLSDVPKNLPSNSEIIDLQGNQITTIRRRDFKGLRDLQSLRLLDNAISSIEPKSLEDLVSLQEILLNRNRLTKLPDKLFSNCHNLRRIDASSNKLHHIRSNLLKGTSSLTKLLLNTYPQTGSLCKQIERELENNDIECMARDALSDSPNLEIISLNRNHLPFLSHTLFSQLRKLTALKLNYNRLRCDCQLLWMMRWLRANPSLAMFAKCHEPASLSGQRLADVDTSSLNCQFAYHQGALVEENVIEPCADKCPKGCTCNGVTGVVNCSIAGLKKIPESIPKYAMKLSMDKNQLEEIPAMAFASLDNLETLDLNLNQISILHPGSFQGLESLNSLVLYGNRIKELPSGIFNGLHSLKALFLSSNQLACIPPDLFSSLSNLNLLSLFDNRIMTLGRGMFTPLKNLQTLHLARNPLLCNCRLRWLGEYLRRNPVESSGALCKYPPRLAHRQVQALYRNEVIGDCPGEPYEQDEIDAERGLLVKNPFSSARVDKFFSDGLLSQQKPVCSFGCPSKCHCHGNTVNCTGAGLTLEDLDPLPPHTKKLVLKNNRISALPAKFFEDVPLLESLDLTDNQITIITPGTFEYASNLVELLLTSNQITSLESGALTGLSSLRFLMLRDNHLECLKNATFSKSPHLRLLSLYGNQIGCIQRGAFDKLAHLETLNLLGNPIACDCRLRWFPAWVSRIKTSATVAAKCTSPPNLVDHDLKLLSESKLVCPNLDNNQGQSKPGLCKTSRECCKSKSEADDRKACHPPIPCPSACDCVDTELRCSKRRLKKLPLNIGMDTTKLYFNGNLLESIPNRINQYGHLVTLDLNFNRLKHIAGDQFANLSSLNTLILSNNQIQCVDRAAFAGLRNLRLLFLHHNQIVSLPHGLFNWSPSIHNIVINDNPLRCDCQMKWLSEWVKSNYREAGVATCASPRRMAGAVISSSDVSRFQCMAEDKLEEGEVVEKASSGKQYLCGACLSSKAVLPCREQGVCTDEPFGRYSCKCFDGFSGPDCEMPFLGDGKPNDGCHKCNNRSVCKVEIATGDYSCVCKPGYSGTGCSVATLRANPCDNHRCVNGGSCKPTATSSKDYVCQCQPGWKGKYCEKLFTLKFNKRNAYVKLVNDRTPMHNATLLFSTSQPTGVLYYQGGKKAHFTVKLVESKIKISLVKVNYPTDKMPMFQRLSENLVANDDKWVADGHVHKLTVLFYPDNITTIVNDGKAHFLFSNAGSSPNKNIVTYIRKKMATIGSSNSFQGCLSGMFSDGKQVDFENADVVKFRVGKPCSGSRKPDNACVSKPCLNGGTCNPITPFIGRPTSTAFKCTCRPNYYGKTCSQKGKCQTVMSKETLIDDETGCHSKYSVKVRTCRGKCGNSCCQPMKYKKKTIRFICSDGRKITKPVSLVRKCACSNCDTAL